MLLIFVTMIDLTIRRFDTMRTIFADMERYGRLIRNFLIFKQIQQFKSLLATIFPENSSLVCVNAKKGRVKLSALRRLFSFAVVRQMVSVVSY